MDVKRQFNACIFNLDGVIVDTGKYHYQAWRRLANQLGFDFPETKSIELKNTGRIASLEKVLDWGNIYMPEAEKLHWADVKNNWYQELIANMKPGEVLPGVLLFLRQLRELGIRTAVCSLSQNVQAVLKSTNLESFFDVVLDGAVIKKQKPDPQCFLQAAAMLGLKPQECLVFEGSTQGIEAALAGGFLVVGIGQPASLQKAHLTLERFENLNFNTLLAQLNFPAVS
jgi:beta-phosphoglucomutase